MKAIKTFRITPENQKELKEVSKYLNRYEGWVINTGLSEYIDYIKSTPGFRKPFEEKPKKVNKDFREAIS